MTDAPNEVEDREAERQYSDSVDRLFWIRYTGESRHTYNTGPHSADLIEKQLQASNLETAKIERLAEAILRWRETYGNSPIPGYCKTNALKALELENRHWNQAWDLAEARKPKKKR